MQQNNINQKNGQADAALESYTAERKAPSKPICDLFEVIESLVIAIISVVFVFTFIARLSIVDGASMEKTLQNGDRLIVANLFLSYEPKCGDIIVAEPESYGKPIVKRVIATEGQEIKIRYSETLGCLPNDFYEIYVDGELVYEDYAFYDENRTYVEVDNPQMVITKQDSVVTATAIVPEGCVFAMGDNRNNSLDSRSDDIGFIQERDILGKVVFRLLPLNKIGTLN